MSDKHNIFHIQSTASGIQVTFTRDNFSIVCTFPTYEEALAWIQKEQKEIERQA